MIYNNDINLYSPYFTNMLLHIDQPDAEAFWLLELMDNRLAHAQIEQ